MHLLVLVVIVDGAVIAAMMIGETVGGEAVEEVGIEVGEVVVVIIDGEKTKQVSKGEEENICNFYNILVGISMNGLCNEIDILLLNFHS